MAKSSLIILVKFICGILWLTSTINLYGQPTKSYFQQKLDYKIKARLDDVTHTVLGNVEILYTNQSSNNLDTIWFHLWPNAYSGRNTPLCKQKLNNRDASLYFADDTAKGRIDSISFLVEGMPVKTYAKDQNPEMVALVLNQELKSGQSTTISTSFKVKVPDAKFSRMGREGDAYYMTQWYPKPAVYDNNGWHPMPYLDQGEFYSEFGNFEVELDVAANYIVAASGVLLDEAENEKMRKLSSLYGSTMPTSDGAPVSSPERKTLRYRLTNAHDFAWFADKQFQVSLDSVILTSGKKVAVAVYHTPKKSELWKEANSYSANGLKFLSDAIGDYPYETFTVVDGRISAGGGMEYPSITILNSPSDAESLERILIHELGHNWFYAALASNERDHPWMDEGINSYYEQLYMAKARKSDPASQSSRLSNQLEKILGQSLNEDSLMNLLFDVACFDHNDQPIHTKSEEFTSFNYGVIAYMKTARAMGFLYDYLGEELATKLPLPLRAGVGQRGRQIVVAQGAAAVAVRNQHQRMPAVGDGQTGRGGDAVRPQVGGTGGTGGRVEHGRRHRGAGLCRGALGLPADLVPGACLRHGCAARIVAGAGPASGAPGGAPRGRCHRAGRCAGG